MTLARAQSAPPLLHQMVGKWDVTERMWPGAHAAPISLPAAISERRLIADSLLEDTMVAVPGTKPPFTRIAYLNYNAVTKQYEYFSWDTRAPQMMTEKSRGTDARTLYGGTFVAPQWGKKKNVAFRYRLVLGSVQNARQRVQLYFTPVAGNEPEFLAFEYVYTKRT
jgi:hypothetical protein